MSWPLGLRRLLAGRLAMLVGGWRAAGGARAGLAHFGAHIEEGVASPRVHKCCSLAARSVDLVSKRLGGLRAGGAGMPGGQEGVVWVAGPGSLCVHSHILVLQNGIARSASNVPATTTKPCQQQRTTTTCTACTLHTPCAATLPPRLPAHLWV